MQNDPLDEVVDPSEGRVRFLKSDTDGEDAGVILSAASILDRDHPILFFECEMDTLEQKSAFEKLFEILFATVYSNWLVFDNFGGLMLQTRDITAVRQLLNYVWRRNLEQATRTIYYYDLLIATDADLDLVTRATLDSGMAGSGAP